MCVRVCVFVCVCVYTYMYIYVFMRVEKNNPVFFQRETAVSKGGFSSEKRSLIFFKKSHTFGCFFFHKRPDTLLNLHLTRSRTINCARECVWKGGGLGGWWGGVVSLGEAGSSIKYGVAMFGTV